MKDNEKIIKQMELGDLFILMEIFMKENGKMILLMDTEFIKI